MNNRLKHYLVLLGIGIVYLAIIPFHNTYPFLSGIFWIAFWGYSLWMDILLGRGFLKTTKQKVLVLLVSCLALIYFLPIDIQNQKVVSILGQVLNTALILSVFFDDDDDNTGGKKVKGKKVNRKKLRWMPETN